MLRLSGFCLQKTLIFFNRAFRGFLRFPNRLVSEILRKNDRRCIQTLCNTSHWVHHNVTDSLDCGNQKTTKKNLWVKVFFFLDDFLNASGDGWQTNKRRDLSVSELGYCGDL